MSPSAAGHWSRPPWRLPCSWRHNRHDARRWRPHGRMPARDQEPAAARHRHLTNSARRGWRVDLRDLTISALISARRGWRVDLRDLRDLPCPTRSPSSCSRTVREADPRAVQTPELWRAHPNRSRADGCLRPGPRTPSREHSGPRGSQSSYDGGSLHGADGCARPANRE